MSRRKILLLFLPLVFGLLFLAGPGIRPAYAALCESQGNGNWSNPSTWTGCSGYPGQYTNDYVRILNGHTVTLDISPGAVYFVEIQSGGALVVSGNNTLQISASGGTPGFSNSGTFTAGSGTVEFNTSYGSASSTIAGTVAFNNVTISGVGVNFGGGSTVNGVLTINSGGWVDTNPPAYGSTSTLLYNTGGIYGRGAEWSATSGPGYPNHVRVSNNTGLDLGNGGTGTARALAGNLTVDAGSGLYMDYGSNDMTAPLTVGGDVLLDGTLSLSDSPGGDLLVGGNWTNNGNFYAKGRQVTLNGSGAQYIGGSALTTFDYLLVDNAAAGAVTLNADIVVRRELKINDSSAELSAGSATITLQGDATAGPVFWNNGTFNRGTGTVVFTGENNRNGRVLGSAVTIFNHVTLSRNVGGSGNFGVDFYDHDTGRRAHIAGTLTLNQFTFIASEENGSATGCAPSDCDGTPFYDAGSTLRYQNSGPFHSAAEWWPDDATPTCGSDKGMPYNVVITNGTALDIHAAFANNGRAPSYPAGSNKTACGSLTIAAGSALTSTAGILSVKDDWTRSGTFIHNGGTVRFNGSGGSDGIQTVTGNTTFYNLTLNSQSGVKVYFGNTTTTIVHDLDKVSGSGTMDPGNGTFLFIGTPSNILGGGEKAFYDLEVAAGTTTYHTTGGKVQVYHSFVNNGTFVEGAAQDIYFNGGGHIGLSGSGTTTFGSVWVQSSSTLNAGTHSFRVVGDRFAVLGGNTFNGGTATVTFANSSGTALNPALANLGTYNFYNLTIDSGAVVRGPLYGSKTIYVAGTWTNNGTYVHNDGLVVLNGSSVQTIGGNNQTAFYNLTLNNAAGAVLGRSERVEHTLTLSNGRLTLGNYDLVLGSAATAVGGTLGASRMVVADGAGRLCKEYAAAGSFTFPVGDAGGTAEYSPAVLNFTSGTFDSGQACINLADDRHPNNPSTSDYLTRYWTVTASGITNFTCTATFSYVEADVVGTESNIQALRYHEGNWTAGDPVDATNHRFTMTVNLFSDFTGGALPAAVKLLTFAARPDASGVLLTWETASEHDNVGFNLYRSASLQERGEKVNAGLIFSRSPGGGEGASYVFLDTTARPGQTYFYTLEDVDLNGRRAFHGPVAISFWRVYLPLVLRRR